MSGRQIAALVVICIVLIAAAFQLGVVKEYQLDRLRAFLDRENTPADVRYNLDQAEIAVGSGGLVGQGFLHGRQTTLDYVPEQHTDFIFTVAGEEFGFVGPRSSCSCTRCCCGERSASPSSRRTRSARTWRPAWRACSRSDVREHRDGDRDHADHGIPLPFLSYGGARCSRAASVWGCC